MNVVKRFVPPRRLTRQRISRTWLLSSLALVLTLLAGCIPIQPAATPATITLRFAVPEAPGRTLAPYVLEFVDQVNTLSKGTLTIEPVWDPMAGTPGGGEDKLIQMVLDGQFDLALANSRAWDAQNVPSLYALQAPFLITNDALAAAVATSDVATRMLESLSTAGAVGLTLWPEDLRHPFSVMPDKPLLAPEDFAGLVIRAGSSVVTNQILEALGASRTSEDSGYQGAETGLTHGYTLMGKPTPTGNVTFYTKFQVLFANGKVFAQLSAAQQDVIRQAATAAQTKALAEHLKEADAATAWCADGGTVVLASDAQVSAFEKAAQPVFDQLEQDPINAELIAAIRELKANTPPSPGAAACGPAVTQPNPAPLASSVQGSTSDATMARLRLANWVYGCGATDMYVDGQIAFLGSNQRELANVSLGFLTGFLYLDPGLHQVAVVPTGKGLDEAMIALEVTLEVGHRYTVGVMGQKEDAHFSPLVVDETVVLAEVGNPSEQNIMIYVNNVAGADTVDFLEDGVGPSKVPYGGFVAAPIQSGHVDELVVTINGKTADRMGNFDELPSSSLLLANGGHFPDGPTKGYESGGSCSDLTAREMLQQFSEISVVWNEGARLSFTTFLAAVEQAGLSDLLTTGTYLIFAPTDAVFEAMPKEQLATLMADPDALADFLRYHIVEGYYPPGSLSGRIFGVADGTVTNLQGAELKLEGDLSINGIRMPGLPNMTVVNGTRIVPVTKVLVAPAK